ncbi:hypothetical protein [Pseudoxanthomonas composti]|uniref:Uncharacterized protein n=1 Tax=Pseudoxanthomonas composti TaxID=2137479 RepID=A0A4Q1JS66_9GAMM|nr:hypothetical protein [Pseudoxanthomonas composti]RXQ98913.1 hypothetical protein EPA99_18235 [Pseudoxanthomonas composti]
MRLLTSMLYCLLALFGCDGGSTSTTVTRRQLDGQDILFSRTTVEAGQATFQCVRSSSGRCHYQVFEEACAAADPAHPPQCARTALDQFSLAVGERRQVKGLAAQVKDCVDTEASTLATRCGM